MAPKNTVTCEICGQDKPPSLIRYNYVEVAGGGRRSQAQCGTCRFALRSTARAERSGTEPTTNSELNKEPTA